MGAGTVVTDATMTRDGTDNRLGAGTGAAATTEHAHATMAMHCAGVPDRSHGAPGMGMLSPADLVTATNALMDRPVPTTACARCTSETMAGSCWGMTHSSPRLAKPNWAASVPASSEATTARTFLMRGVMTRQ